MRFKKSNRRGSVAIATGQTAHASLQLPPEQLPDDAETANLFGVQLEHSWGGTSCRIIIKNRSSRATIITSVSPSFLPAEPGLFDFAELTSQGPLTLEADEEVQVPLKSMATPVSDTHFGHFDHTIQKCLRESLAIETDTLTIAGTSVALTPRIV